MANLKNYLAEIKKNDQQGKKINAMLQLNPNLTPKDVHQGGASSSSSPSVNGDINTEGKNSKKGVLSGKVIAVKANINVCGLTASCGSKVLENYKSPYDATVIKKIKDEGGIILGMANMDEFACGWSGELSAFGATRNPVKTDLVSGGSSSGPAASVAAGFCDMALGSDTGGSIRVPSSHCGVVGVKPTYGSVSRYGLIDMCMSFDQIGPIAKNVSDAALLLSVIQGRDECDATSQDRGNIDLTPQAYNLKGCENNQELREPFQGLQAGPEKSSTKIFTRGKIEETPKNLKVGLLDFPIADKRIQKIIDDKIKEASEKYGWKVEKVKIPYLDLAIATYFPIVYVEFFSSTRRFDGRRYGKKIEDVCGPEVLRRILGGNEITKAEHEGRYYNQALKVRGLLQKEFEKVFRKFDCIISPTVPKLPHKIGAKISAKEMFQYDALTCPMNIVGNCAMSLPVGFIPTRPPFGKKKLSGETNNSEGIPVGMQIACDKFQDELMLRIGRGIEKFKDF